MALAQELHALEAQVVRMGGLAQRMIQRSVQALLDRDESMAEEVFLLERTVNRLHVDIDAACVRLIALRQPMAADLRFIAAAMKINSDIERMADQAVNVSQTALFHLFKEPPVPEADMVFRMAEIAQKMAGLSLEAFEKRDVPLAGQVLSMDAEQDALKARVLTTLIERLPSAPELSAPFVEIILISKNFERIADHATNIAEDVVYLVLGKDIRHTGAKQPAAV